MADTTNADAVNEILGRKGFFWQTPNLVDALGLSVYEFRLLLHFYRVVSRGSGLDGACWESTQKIAKTCRMSIGSVVKAKGALEDKGLIAIEERTNQERGGRPYHRVTVTDLQAVNVAHGSELLTAEDAQVLIARGQVHLTNLVPILGGQVHLTNLEEPQEGGQVHQMNKQVHQVACNNTSLRTPDKAFKNTEPGEGLSETWYNMTFDIREYMTGLTAKAALTFQPVAVDGTTLLMEATDPEYRGRWPRFSTFFRRRVRTATDGTVTEVRLLEEA